jgi:uncharacterized damage-inducible protein DinB
MARQYPPGTGAEREVLTGFLDWQRDTVGLKVTHLRDEDADRSLLPTSPRMTVAGVLSHLRQTEHEWFAGSFPSRASTVQRDPQGGWTHSGAPLAELLHRYQAECERSQAVVQGLDLDQMQEFTPEPFSPVSLRWILVHMIEETARHLGHLDIIREQLDGTRSY